MWSNPVTLFGVNERLDRTQEMPTDHVRFTPPKPRKPDFQPGKASVPPKRTDSTISFEPTLPPGRIVTQGQLKRPSKPLRERLRLLRSGGRWTATGAIVLLVCWGLWASDSGGDLATEGLMLVLIFLVSLGLFAISRLAGGVILEKIFSRTRRSAVLSHMAIGLFLSIVGIKLLTQVSWVITAVGYLRGVR